MGVPAYEERETARLARYRNHHLQALAAGCMVVGTEYERDVLGDALVPEPEAVRGASDHELRRMNADQRAALVEVEEPRDYAVDLARWVVEAACRAVGRSDYQACGSRARTTRYRPCPSRS